MPRDLFADAGIAAPVSSGKDLFEEAGITAPVERMPNAPPEPVVSPDKTYVRQALESIRLKKDLPIIGGQNVYEALPTMGKTAFNLPESTIKTGYGVLKGIAGLGMDVGKSYVNLLTSPFEGATQLQTPHIQGIVDMLGGLQGKLLQPIAGDLSTPEQKQALENVVNGIVSQYGSYDKFKQTMENDPASVALTAASVLYPAARLTEVGAAAAGLPRLAEAATAARTISGEIMAAPVTVPVKAAKAATSFMAPESIMNRVLKLPTTMGPIDKREIYRTLESADATVSPEGYQNLMDKVDALHSERMNVVKDLAGIDVSPNSVIKATDSAMKIAKVSSTKGKDITRLEQLKDDWLRDYPEGSIDVPQATEMMQSIYKELQDNAYGGEKLPSVDVNFKKSIARGLKESIEKAAGTDTPSGRTMAEMGKEESRLLKAEPHLRRAVGRTTNANFLSLDSEIMAAAGAAAGGLPGAALATVVRHATKSAKYQSKFAFGLERAKRWGGSSTPTELNAIPPKLDIMGDEYGVSDMPIEEYMASMQQRKLPGWKVKGELPEYAGLSGIGSGTGETFGIRSGGGIVEINRPYIRTTPLSAEEQARRIGMAREARRVTEPYPDPQKQLRYSETPQSGIWSMPETAAPTQALPGQMEMIRAAEAARRPQRSPRASIMQALRGSPEYEAARKALEGLPIIKK